MKSLDHKENNSRQADVYIRGPLSGSIFSGQSPVPDKTPLGPLAAVTSARLQWSTKWNLGPDKGSNCKRRLAGPSRRQVAFNTWSSPEKLYRGAMGWSALCIHRELTGTGKKDMLVCGSGVSSLHNSHPPGQLNLHWWINNEKKTKTKNAEHTVLMGTK